ncbi:MAG: thioredoxin family protein [Pseudomonadota bacterium]
MARKSQNKKVARKRSSGGAPAQASKSKPMTRRDMMGWVKFGAIGLAVFGGGGFYFTSKIMAGIAEADLEKIGNGIPTIVQIHDPGCPTCNRLQRAAREALEGFADQDLQYLVANLNDPDGRRFADGHGVGRVTLLFFDGEGNRVGMLNGARSVEELSATFQNYLTQVRAGASG